MRTPEGKEKDRVKQYLKSIGAWYCCPFTGGYGRSGVPDIIACIKGTLWGIEVKRPGGQLTPGQIRCFDDIWDADGLIAYGTADEIINGISDCLKRVEQEDNEHLSSPTAH